MEVRMLAALPEAAESYPCATGSPPPFWAEGLELSRRWLAENLGRHIEGFHLEEDGKVIGHLYWAPSEGALAPFRTEPRVAWLYCEWVQRPYRRQGGMRTLFSAFVHHLQAAGHKGVLVGATDYEDYMHRSHFAKRGFRPVEGAEGLMYLPLRQASVDVEPLEQRVDPGGGSAVQVLAIGWLSCPVGAAAVLYLRRVAEELGDRVVLREVPAGPEAMEQYGVASGIFINGERAFFGPVTEAEVRARLLGALATRRDRAHDPGVA